MIMSNTAKINKGYILVVFLLTLFLPALSVFIETLIKPELPLSNSILGKWFIFWAVGLRLLIAGLRQASNPSFTAETIFHIENKESHIIIRELGFANICFGLIGVLSLFLPQWRIVSAFGSGLFYGIAGINHIIKKPVGSNEMIALVSDIFIFICLLVYVLVNFTTTPE
jgi:hypothetical protein